MHWGDERMITLKSSHEIELMRRAGKITAAARALAGEMVRPGVTTQEIDSCWIFPRRSRPMWRVMVTPLSGNTSDMV